MYFYFDKIILTFIHNNKNKTSRISRKSSVLFMNYENEYNKL